MVAANWHRLLAYVRKCADESTDVDVLLADATRKAARVYCKRRMSDELFIRYLMRCLRNAARKAHVQNLRRIVAEDRFGREEEQHRQLHLQHQEAVTLRQTLREVLRELPPLHARVLVMKVWEKRNFADMARELGVSETTARRYYETAIEKARNMMTL